MAHLAVPANRHVRRYHHRRRAAAARPARQPHGDASKPADRKCPPARARHQQHLVRRRLWAAHRGGSRDGLETHFPAQLAPPHSPPGYTRRSRSCSVRPWLSPRLRRRWRCGRPAARSWRFFRAAAAPRGSGRGVFAPPIPLKPFSRCSGRVKRHSRSTAKSSAQDFPGPEACRLGCRVRGGRALCLLQCRTR